MKKDYSTEFKLFIVDEALKMFRSHTYCTFFSLKKAGIPYNLIN